MDDDSNISSRSEVGGDSEEKVGWKKPPKSGQFSKTNQPNRTNGRQTNKKRKEVDRPASAAKALSDAAFEPVEITRNGKTEKTFYIMALIHSMKRNGFKASLSDQLKLFREFVRAGVFEVEGFKQRYRSGIKRHYREYIGDLLVRLDQFIALLADAQVLISLAMFQKLAIALCRSECTCGAAEKHLAETEKFNLTILNLAEPGDCKDEGVSVSRRAAAPE